MIYLVGIDHLIQYENRIVPGNLFNAFRDFIKNIIQSHGIDLIAEEFHEEYLEQVYFSREATLRALARELGKDHLFCDPGDGDRRRLGIPYYAEQKDAVKRRYGITGTFVFDEELRKKIQDDTDREVMQYWDIREKFWFEKLAPHLERHILFVCGHEHVKRFKTLLENKGQACMIVVSFWEGDYFRSL